MPTAADEATRERCARIEGVLSARVVQARRHEAQQASAKRAQPQRRKRPSSGLAAIRAEIDASTSSCSADEPSGAAGAAGRHLQACRRAHRRFLPARARGRSAARALERNHGPLRNEEIVRLFREIMSACLAQQEPLKVAFLGPEGTFTQQAVLKHFGHSVRALALPTVDEVFHEVEAGNADFGVVAIENSSEGTVTTRSIVS
jgi:chorismate mutase/prephenate dehydratase